MITPKCKNIFWYVLKNNNTINNTMVDAPISTHFTSPQQQYDWGNWTQPKECGPVSQKVFLSHSMLCSRNGILPHFCQWNMRSWTEGFWETSSLTTLESQTHSLPADVTKKCLDPTITRNHSAWNISKAHSASGHHQLI